MKSGYRKGATWLMTTETLGELQALTDSQGRPLWAPIGVNIGETLLGYPYKEMPDMPQDGNNGGSNGTFTVAFGNFKVAYQLVIRKQVSIQVLQERYADQNAVGYMGYYRFGGMVKLGEAIKLLKVHS
jgi:HK97 family phage major capsid protein